MGNTPEPLPRAVRTYCRVNVMSLRQVKEARTQGAKRLAAEQSEAKTDQESERSAEPSPNSNDDEVLSA
jgi:hypothetical protein